MIRCDGTVAVSGNCPATYSSDYVIASFTFNGPLGANLSSVNRVTSPNLIAWTMGDAAGATPTLSSSDANAATELATLVLSTNSSGAITAWTMQAATVGFTDSPFLAGSVFYGISNPTFIGGSGFPNADDLVFGGNGGDVNVPGGGYNLSSGLPGMWTQGGATTKTYQYTGSPFTACSVGTCPSNYTSDYLMASLTFSAALPANLASTNELTSPNLLAWSIGDALGYVSFSSADAKAASELMILTLSTDSNGNIVDYGMVTNLTVFPAAAVANPPVGSGVSLTAETITYKTTTTPQWTALTANLGQWPQPLSGTGSGGGSITYEINQNPIGVFKGAVTGTLTTDGTTGTLAAANIVSWDLVVYDGSTNTYVLTGGQGGNSTLALSGSALTATATQLSFNFGATGSLEISEGPVAWLVGVNQGFEGILPVGTASMEFSNTVTLGTTPAPAFSTPNAFFNGQQPSSVAGWDFLQFQNGNLFGYYSFAQGSASTANAWLFHADLGYEYVIPGSTAGAEYFYDLASKHWWFTSSSLFPYVYDFNLNSWLFYFANTQSAGRYSANPRYFSNLTTGMIITE